MATQRPHALYIAWGFPPSRGSGVYRALATANGLVTAGFDVTVLTCDRETFLRYTGVDTALEEQVDPAIEIVRVPFDWPLMEIDIRRWSKRRARRPVAYRTAWVENSTREFPEATYGPWLAPLREAAEEIHRRRPVDLSVATANPNVDIAAAHHLRERFGVPYVMDQRDAWTLDMYAEQRIEDEPRIAWERRFVNDATEAWFVNEPLREWHATQYPEAGDRIHAVHNGYDPALAPAPRLRAADPEKPLRFGYVGTLTPYMPMAEFVAGWQRAREVAPDLAGAEAELYGYLGFYASEDVRLRALLTEAAQAGVDYRGPVPKSDVAALYERFDAVMLILGTGRFITSGKVFEYMASALPVVSVHDPRVDSSRVLADYPLWFPARDLSTDGIAEALAAAAEAARSAGADVRRACVEYAEAYERGRILQPRLERLRDMALARREA